MKFCKALLGSVAVATTIVGVGAGLIWLEEWLVSQIGIMPSLVLFIWFCLVLIALAIWPKE